MTLYLEDEDLDKLPAVLVKQLMKIIKKNAEAVV
jgi:hypothetical protein